MDILFLAAVSGGVALALLIIAHFTYQRSPNNLRSLFFPSGLVLLISIIALIISLASGGFRGLGFGILSAAAGAGSIIGIIGIALLTYIGNKR
ncbi:YesK family protein [Paenibacillus sp. GCM10012307]|uniref:YesK-like protein n=1 Tax=Paenibacillus roseus TaxID=2798579 RepID=A0A934J0N9_9BACL|nr:YesK family protein [Paenibacillus roseus]MBJ6361154.1 hypothetical protein [Paenibacillus roseus]